MYIYSLSFLGTIYNAVIQSFTDMNNLSELLAEEPDVEDIKNAPKLKLDLNNYQPNIEFSNVSFHYPTQNKSAGLQNVNFFIKAGTETAIVGSTGSGKKLKKKKKKINKFIFIYINIYI